jgi:ABC-type transporter Mla MlaB component
MKTENFSVTPLATSTNNTQLLLEGQLVIRNAGIIKKELLSALTNSQNLELIFKNIIRADISFLQMIIALQKSATNLGKEISLDAGLNGPVKSAIINSGLEKNFGTI